MLLGVLDIGSNSAQSFDLPLRPLNGSTYGQDAPGGRHVTLVTTSSG